MLWPQVEMEFLEREVRLVSALAEDEAAVLLEDVVYFRKLLSMESSPPLDLVCSRAKLVTRLCDLMVPGVPEEVRLEAAWAVTNICSGTAEHCAAAMQNGAHGRFIQALSPHESITLKDQCVWGLGNIAGDGQHARDLCWGMGAVEKILACFPHANNAAPAVTKDFIRNATWALCNFFRGADPPAFGQRSRDALHCVLRVLQDALGMGKGELWKTPDLVNNREIASDAMWCVKYLVVEEGESAAAPGAQHLLDTAPGWDWLHGAMRQFRSCLLPAVHIAQYLLTHAALQDHASLWNVADALLGRLFLAPSPDLGPQLALPPHPCEGGALQSTENKAIVSLSNLVRSSAVLRERCAQSGCFTMGMRRLALAHPKNAGSVMQVAVRLFRACTDDQKVQLLQQHPCYFQSMLTCVMAGKGIDEPAHDLLLGVEKVAKFVLQLYRQEKTAASTAVRFWVSQQPADVWQAAIQLWTSTDADAKMLPGLDELCQLITGQTEGSQGGTSDGGAPVKQQTCVADRLHDDDAGSGNHVAPADAAGSGGADPPPLLELQAPAEPDNDSSSDSGGEEPT